MDTDRSEQSDLSKSDQSSKVLQWDLIRITTMFDILTDLVSRCSIYRQFESCPKPDMETSDPDCLTVPLMTHQRQALTWLIWREKQKPSGGILGFVLFTLNSCTLFFTYLLINIQKKEKRTKCSLEPSAA